MGGNWSNGFAWLLAALTGVNLIIGIANTVWTWWNKGAAEVTEQLKEMTRKLIDHDRRIQSAESELRHMPSKEQVSALVTEMRGVTERLSAMRDEQRRQGESIGRIEDVMLEKKP